MELKSSPFYPLFSTNYAPSSKEVNHIHDLLCLPEQELRSTDEDISRLESLLDDLKVRKEKVAAFIHHHRQLLSPIRRLPPEILAEIFIHCLPENHLPTRNLTDAPLLITLVCKQWRKIALNTPFMWCALHVYIPQTLSSDEVVWRRKSGIETWFKRSGNLPISLSLAHRYSPPFDPDGSTLEHHTPDPYSDDGPIYSLMQSLLSYSHRWKDLTLNIPATGLQLISDIPRGKLTLLQRMAVQMPFNTDSVTPFIRFLESLPELDALCLRDYPESKLQSPFRWSKLTELTLLPPWGESAMSFNGALDILSQINSLRTCKLMLTLNNLSEHDPVNLPQLDNLSLTFWGVHTYNGSEAIPIQSASSLIAPSLTCLTVKCVCGHENMPSAYSFYTELLTCLLSNSEAGIQFLNVGVQIPFNGLIQSLEFAPALKSLVIGSARYYRRPRRHLAYPGLAGENINMDLVHILSPAYNNNSPLCPELTSLKFLNAGPLPSPTAFLDLLRFRRKKLRTLEALSVSTLNGDTVNPVITEEIAQLRKEGIDICIAYRKSSAMGLPSDSPFDGFLDDDTANDTWKHPNGKVLIYI